MSLKQEKKSIKTILVKQGNRICCPTPEHESWNQHPRVYIDFGTDFKGTCPYCSTHFEIAKDNENTDQHDA